MGSEMCIRDSGVIAALQRAGASTIQIANRTFEKAQTLAECFDRTSAVGWGVREEALKSASLLVNTTSLGMTGQPALDMDLTNLSAKAVVADIVYTPLQTPLLKAAAARELRTVDGLSMLMHQAVPGFTAWFSTQPVVDEGLRAILVEELMCRDPS